MQRARSQQKILVPRLPGADANEESPDRLFRLANRLLHGYGLEKDPARAHKLFEMAVQKDHVDAMYSLAALLENGDVGVQRDPPSALTLYERAIAEGGHVGAMTSLASLLLKGADGVERDPKRAVALYERAIEQGSDDEAMAFLACVLHEGIGVAQDEVRALELYRRAREVDNACAMNNLATLSLQGASGVTHDSQVACALYLRAAEQGNTTAMRNLALLYSRGAVGVPKDLRLATNFASEAVAREPKPTNRLLLARLLLSKDVGELRNPRRGRDILWELVAEFRYGPAMHDLAKLLSRGDDGVMLDPERAEELRNLAQSADHTDQDEEYRMDLSGVSVDVRKERNKDVERKLRAAKVKQSQCFLLTLGGGGRGKTSTVRSLRGMKFVQEHIPTELASLSRMQVVPGGRHMTDKELEDIAMKSESLVANLSRVAEFPEPEEKPSGESVTAMGDTEHLHEQQKNGNRNVSGAGESTMEVEDVDRSPGLGGSSDHVESASSKRDFSSVLDRASTALEEDPFPVGVEGALVQCWDLGGQGQYMMAHAFFVGFGSIFLFIIDLSKLWNPDTRREEIMELCRWMQLVYVSVEKPVTVRPIIVGTRKGCCEDIDVVWEVLRCGLRKELSDAVYDTWVKDQSRTEQGVGWRVPFVAIENSQAIDDPEGSGVVELEVIVNEAANSVVDGRMDVPARWVALVEELEKIECVFLSKNQVCEIVDGFPAFDADKRSREEDAVKALRYYRGLGRLVLFEMSEDEYILFPDPSVILGFVRKVTGPEELARQRLGRQNAETLNEGILTPEGLASLWEEYPGRTIPVMLELLCRFDILMRLQGDTSCSGESEDLIGIPALLPSGMEGFRWAVKPGELELHFASHFDEAMPPGLAGSLIAHLHRTIGGQRTRVGFLRSNAAILSARVVTGSARIVVAFFGERRRLVWTVRAQDPTGVARSCMESLEEFIDGPLHEMKIPRRHVIVCDCKADPHGCGGSASVEFEVPRSWVLGRMDTELGKVRGYCMSCEEPWRPWELMSEHCLRLPEDTVERPVRLAEAAVPYDVFISHAGSDKQSAAYPLYEFLEAGGLRCFLDEEGIEVSRRTTDAQLYAAIRGSKAAVFILSADFIGRKWPMRELRGFLNLVDRAAVEERDGPLLLPLFYKLRVEECKNGSLPHVEGYETRFRANGFFEEDRQNECSTEQAMEAVGRLTRFPGLRNDVGESEKEFAWRVACRLFKFFRNEGSAAGV